MAFAQLPLFTDAFIADTTHLDATQTGAYLMLLMSAWRSKDCSLPDDDAMLARMARCTSRQWSKLKGAVMAFWDLENGKWIQKRLLKEWVYVTEKCARNRELGSRGGKAKALKNNKPDLANASPTLEPEGKRKASEPTPTPNKEKEITNVISKKTGSRLAENWALPREWGVWAKANSQLSESQIRLEAEKFRDFWISKTGAGATKLNWQATWRNWIRNCSVKPERELETETEKLVRYA